MLTEFQKMSNKMMDACFAAQSFESKLKGVFKHLRNVLIAFLQIQLHVKIGTTLMSVFYS